MRYTAQGIGRFRRSSRKLSTLTRPFDPPPTFINHTLTPERRFATATLALDDIKETRKQLGVGPLISGSGMNITVWSYADQLSISVLTDAATVDDPHEVTDAMIDDFRALRMGAGLPGELTRVDNAMPLATATQ